MKMLRLAMVVLAVFVSGVLSGCCNTQPQAQKVVTKSACRACSSGQ